jgi:hypothetical protein
MIIYTNGCSHTDDFPWEERYDLEHKKSYSWPIKLMDRYSNSYKYIRQSSDFKIINNQEDFLINDSVSGASNDYIFHTSIETLNGLLLNKITLDYIIIQWSGPNRRFHILPDGHTRLFVNPTEHLEYHLKFEPMASTHTLHYMYLLQEELKKLKIQYKFFNYMGVDEHIKTLNTYKRLDFENIVDFGNNTLHNGLIELLKNKNYTQDEMGHANENGNIFISNNLFF